MIVGFLSVSIWIQIWIVKMSIEELLENTTELTRTPKRGKVVTANQDVFDRKPTPVIKNLYDMNLSMDDLYDWLAGLMRSKGCLMTVSKYPRSDFNKDRFWLNRNSLVAKKHNQTFSELFEIESTYPFRTYCFINKLINSLGIREELFSRFESYYGSKNKRNNVFDKSAEMVMSEKEWIKLWKVKNISAYTLGRSGFTPNVKLNDDICFVENELNHVENVKNKTKRKSIVEEIKCKIFENQQCHVYLPEEDFGFQENYDSYAYQSNFIEKHGSENTKHFAKKYSSKTFYVNEKTRKEHNGFRSSIEHIFDHCRINLCENCKFNINSMSNLMLTSDLENSRLGRFAKKDFSEKIEAYIERVLLPTDELKARLGSMSEQALADCGKSCKCYQSIIKAMKIL